MPSAARDGVPAVHLNFHYLSSLFSVAFVSFVVLVVVAVVVVVYGCSVLKAARATCYARHAGNKDAFKVIFYLMALTMTTRSRCDGDALLFRICRSPMPTPLPTDMVPEWHSYRTEHKSYI